MTSLFYRRGPVLQPLALLFALVAVGEVAAESALRVRQVSARSPAYAYATEPTGGAMRPPEKAFLSKAVETSQQQMRLAEVGVGQAESTDVRSHALLMVTDFRAMHDAFEALIRRKGGIAGAPVGRTSETYQELMRKAGGEFDREFVRTVARLSTATLSMFEQVVSESKDTDVRELAAAQLPILRAHRSSIVELQKTYN